MPYHTIVYDLRFFPFEIFSLVLSPWFLLAGQTSNTQLRADVFLIASHYTNSDTANLAKHFTGNSYFISKLNAMFAVLALVGGAVV